MPTAPKTRCAEPGCRTLVDRGRCDVHQRPAWAGRLPFEQRYGMSRSEWDALSRRILIRDGWTCYVCGKQAATQVDHKIPVAEGGSPRDAANLGAICESPCHENKSEAERIRAAQRARSGVGES
ncbi:HNH endonuclease [Micromonospora craniellae]|uniref:HNH endonuclease n=1 Tax=Micromonospora craniellae TaxID=2294034 RepID=A0A372G1Z6_9ACTN|nr:HNH endonuclease signature motif containing protein [Micromonospora craniellae]QOC89868.1 HNH endonuclease [Micromonospora craniellae]RFS47013.1 HNH endonuclease [Micromonospora craniellae]